MSGVRPSPLELTGNAAGVVWPPVFEQHGHLAALALTLQQTQWLDTATLAARQGRQLAALARHHEAATPFFAERMRASGVKAENLRDVAALQRMPVLSRAEAQKLGEAPASTVPKSHLPLYEVQSSGSSGEPVRVRKTQLNSLMWMALTLRYHEWAENGDYGRLAMIRAGTAEALEVADWGTPVSLFHKTGPALRIPVQASLEEQAVRLTAFRPDSLIAYPSNVQALLGLGQAGRDALASVRLLRCMGETLPPDLRAGIEAAGMRVVDCYSAEEVGYLALQCPDGGHYHAMAEALIVEILDDANRPCAPGETGRVVATDLHNYAMPMVRYDTGDYAVAGGTCGCGRGLPVIARVAGRWRGMIVKPDGSRHWPLTGFYGYRKIAPVRQYQMIQHALDRIELRLAVAPLSPAQEQAMRDHLRETLGDGIQFEIVCHDGRLPPGPRGKTDEFISLIGERS